MSKPSVPDGRKAILGLPCGGTKRVRGLDLGGREFDHPCGDGHAVVVDVHPLDRLFPEFLVDILQGTIETTSGDTPGFRMTRLMGIVLEELPEAIVSEDVSEDGELGTGIIWVTDFDSWRLHRIVVGLVVELMECAVSRADDDDVVSEFESKMLQFDVGELVSQYRAQHDLDPRPYAQRLNGDAPLFNRFEAARPPGPASPSRRAGAAPSGRRGRAPHRTPP